MSPSVCRVGSLVAVSTLGWIFLGCNRPAEVPVRPAGGNVEGSLQEDDNVLDSALNVMSAGETERAIEMLAETNIEKCVSESTQKSLNVSESAFVSMSNDERSALQAEAIQILRIVKQAAYRQIDELTAARKRGSSEKSGQIEQELRRLVLELQEANRLRIFQELGTAIEKHLEDVISRQSD